MLRTPRLSRIGLVVVAFGLASTITACGNDDPTAPAGSGSDDNSSSDNSSDSDPDASGTGGGSSDAKIVVGSFAFPESEILGEIYLQALDAKGFNVSSSFNIGPRQQTIPALKDGSINLIPEYNGNLLAYYDTEYTERTTEDVDAALVDAVAADNLQVLDSAEAEDKDAYVVTKETADDNDLSSIGDLANITPFKLGANPQFGELGYGIPGLDSVYGVSTSDVEFVPIEDFGGPDTVKALVDDSVQVADIYTTSPAIVTDDLVVLDDPEAMISSQNVIPLISDDVYSPEVADVLNAISADLSTEDLIDLRNRVEGDEKASAADAATDWLKDKGLI